MIKNIYKPKAKNEIALKTYINNATKTSNDRHSRSRNRKRISNRDNNVCRF